MERLRRWSRSLAFRVIAFSTLWAVVALVVIATVISSLFREVSERGFESVLSAHLFNLISSVRITETGQLTGAPNLGDLRFIDENSGWYWAVEPVSDNVSGELLSLSLVENLPAPPETDVPFDQEFQRRYTMTGPAGETLQVIESVFRVAGQQNTALFRMMGNRSELDADIGAFSRRLFGYLTLFGIGMIAINAIAILLGLEPLSRVRKALTEVRRGKAQRLDGTFPTEIAPLANETNELIDGNRRIVERARTQVGNLAHSLKTPLAVLINEGRSVGNARGRLIVEQATAMQQQVNHYLQRARMAAQRESVVFRTPVAPVMERLVRVVRKLGEGKSVELNAPAADVMFAGEREDLEEIAGNLLENAMKWSAARVRVSFGPTPGTDEAHAYFVLCIEDDGPGIPDDKAREALKRGTRLDETKPGTGLGLAIVADLVNEYGGRLSLGRSDLGGLAARVELRRAPG